MKETIKSIALFFLVTLSLTLTSWLWLGIPRGTGEVARAYETGRERVETRTLADLTGPRQVVISTGGEKHFLVRPDSDLYHRIWLEARSALRAIDGLEMENTIQEEVSRREKVQEEPGPGEEVKPRPRMELVLAASLPADLWLRLWEIEGLKEQAGRSLMMDRVVLVFGENTEVYFVDQGAQTYGRAQVVGGALALRSLMSSLTSEDLVPARALPNRLGHLQPEAGLYVPEHPLLSSRVLLDPEWTNPEETAERFFLDLSFVRRIDEKDGAIIYTDGKRGLRLYPNGVLEFNVPQVSGDRPQVAPVGALEAAITFIARHGGWPDNCYLSSFTGRPFALLDPARHQGRAGSRYEIAFSYRYRGLPVIYPGDMKGAMTTVVMGGEVETYSRLVLKPREEEGPSQLPLLGVEEALAAVDAEIASGNGAGEEITVTDVYLAYQVTPAQAETRWLLNPVWVFETVRGRFVVDALTGEVTKG